MEISKQMAPISRASIYNKMAELGYRKQTLHANSMEAPILPTDAEMLPRDESAKR